MKMLPQLGLAGLLILGTCWLTAGATPAARGQGFTHAFANGTCAPWDGAAVALTLQTAPVPAVAKGKLPLASFPQIDVTLYTSRPPVGQWIEIGLASSHEGGGSIRQFDVPGQCQFRVGRIWLDKASHARYEGELRLVGADKREVSYRFSAPFLFFQEFCG